MIEADKYVESNGSITLCLRDIDIMDNAPTLDDALNIIAADLLDYAREYDEIWAVAPNRIHHRPYVKAVLATDPDKVKNLIKVEG